LPYISTPSAHPDTVLTLADFLRISGEWHQKHWKAESGMLSQLWYRGVNAHFANQAPGVYREKFTERARRLKPRQGLEKRRLRLEREILDQFRSAGATFLRNQSPVEIYFSAQHFGAPTRLLDWSTNPLAALFFACNDAPSENGFVYGMEAAQVIPPDATKDGSEKLYQTVMSMRDVLVEYAVGVSFWRPPVPGRNAYVLPVRPDVVPGRIGQQSSCFTLHMHGAQPVANPTLITIEVQAAAKGPLLDELHRLNVNQFTTYYDLDHLAKEIVRGWGLS
jgi:hypothetical protein